jgi:hypothetical protein
LLKSLHRIKNGYIFVPTNKLKHKTMTKREINTEAKIHHLARLEMMMLEERGIFISYKEAIKRVRNK